MCWTHCTEYQNVGGHELCILPNIPCCPTLVTHSGVGLPGGPRPAKRPSGQPEPYYGWPGWPAIIFHKCFCIHICK